MASIKESKILDFSKFEDIKLKLKNASDFWLWLFVLAITPIAAYGIYVADCRKEESERERRLHQ